MRSRLEFLPSTIQPTNKLFSYISKVICYKLKTVYLRVYPNPYCLIKLALFYPENATNISVNKHKSIYVHWINLCTKSSKK